MSALEQIGKLLGGIGGHVSFAARYTADAGDLHIEVKGIGPLRFPIPRTQARRLLRVARPARYGRGERTLLDRSVRNTSEIAKSRIRIDQRLWNRTLLPVLDRLRRDLGLPDGSVLRAELHSMLVYEPGQFFLPHQDSEKSDDMVGTLVVTLPSSFKGGAFVIEHAGQTVTYRASKQPLSFVAFYADCRHEVRPVTEGYRVVLTYNLMLVRDRAVSGNAMSTAAEARIEALVPLLREHLSTSPPRPRWDPSATPREPRNRLVYLLDHQYTERGLAWDRLKGADAARVAVLGAAAERAGCEMVLALADIHETWECDDDDWDDRHGWNRWFHDDDDAWYDEDDEPPDDPAGYTLGELQDCEITLTRWIGRSGKKAEAISTHVRDGEVCCTTPSSELEPYASEYEGYMGNYGNTMDRWYRRAAVVLWPLDRAFAARAQAAPASAMATLRKQIRAGALGDARAMAASILPFWETVARHEPRRNFLDTVLSVAGSLDDAQIALALLRPFRAEQLTTRHAHAFAVLAERYGEQWMQSLLSGWTSLQDSLIRFEGQDRAAWLASLPRLCEALVAEQNAPGGQAARLLLSDQWSSLGRSIKSALRSSSQRERDDALRHLATPLLAILEGCVIARADDLRHEVVAVLTTEQNDALLPCLMTMLRTAADSLAPETQHAMELAAIRRRCTGILQVRLTAPARTADDWSIAAPRECRCELCATLAGFLAAPDTTRLEWPLAKDKRRHVHDVIAVHELPVRHETQRSGRPYALVLTKTPALFERETAARYAWQKDLDWLRGDGAALVAAR